MVRAKRPSRRGRWPFPAGASLVVAESRDGRILMADIWTTEKIESLNTHYRRIAERELARGKSPEQAYQAALRRMPVR